MARTRTRSRRWPDVERATISVYARHRDYHDLIKGRLKQLAGWMHGRFGAEVKVFVDTAPVLEKPLAQQAGIGWQGKHSNLVSRRFGSWLFLGEIFTDLALPPDPPRSTTAAAAAPAWTSARPTRSRRPTSSMPGAASPTSRSSTRGTYRGVPRRDRQSHLRLRRLPRGLPLEQVRPDGTEAKLQARDDLRAPALAELVRLDDAGFRRRFAGSPIKRTGRDRFVRNVLIAIGNSGEPALAGWSRSARRPVALVRAMAVWALRQLRDAMPWRRYARHREAERDPAVRAEWREALA